MIYLYIALLLAVAIACVYFAVKIRTFLKAKRAAVVKDAQGYKQSAEDYLKKQASKL